MIKNDRLAILRVLAMVSSQPDQHWRCYERKAVFSSYHFGLKCNFFDFVFFFFFQAAPNCQFVVRCYAETLKRPSIEITNVRLLRRYSTYTTLKAP